MSRHLYVVGVFGELACRPFLFTISFCEVEHTNRVAV